MPVESRSEVEGRRIDRAEEVGEKGETGGAKEREREVGTVEEGGQWCKTRRRRKVEKESRRERKKKRAIKQRRPTEREGCSSDPEGFVERRLRWIERGGQGRGDSRISTFIWI